MRPLEWNDGKIRFLDQTKLPLEELYCETDDVTVIADAIKRLAIRGAPLIGIAAAYGVALASNSLNKGTSKDYRKYILSVVDLLASTRPTAVNLFWALERQRNIIYNHQSDSINDLSKRLLEEALKIHKEDKEMCERISSLGAELLPEACNVLTHCNAGALATGGRGTALGIINKAWELGKLKHVYMDETRPLLQGARLTAWEMKKANIPATLIADNTAAVLMQMKKIDAIVIGADRIAMNGDVANKIGSYGLGVLAKQHNVPFYVAAPVSTIDFKIRSGVEIPIEERDEKELTESFGRRIAPEGIDVFSPAFDVTPNDLVTAIITDQGILLSPFSESMEKIKLKLLDLGASSKVW
jgi:methylthioribose-1-phosphate isomerase